MKKKPRVVGRKSARLLLLKVWWNTVASSSPNERTRVFSLIKILIPPMIWFGSLHLAEPLLFIFSSHHLLTTKLLVTGGGTFVYFQSLTFIFFIYVCSKFKWSIHEHVWSRQAGNWTYYVDASNDGAFITHCYHSCLHWKMFVKFEGPFGFHYVNVARSAFVFIWGKNDEKKISKKKERKEILEA